RRGPASHGGRARGHDAHPGGDLHRPDGWRGGGPMRGFAAVFEREFYERRLLWVVALVLSLVPVVLPLMPGLLPGGASVEDLRSGLAFGLAALLAALLALFLGTSMIASDLAERRLRFYFARPLTGWTLWAGKLTACLTLVLGAGLLVLIPAALLGIEG